MGLASREDVSRAESKDGREVARVEAGEEVLRGIASREDKMGHHREIRNSLTWTGYSGKCP